MEINNDQQPEEKPISNEDADKFLNDFMAGHTSGYVTEEESPEPEEVINDDSSSNEQWQGNPAYYQTGKKAGTKRPKRGSDPKGGSDPTIDSSFVTGSLLILLIDLLFPMLFSFANNKFDKKIKISPEEIQMTEKNKKDLEPVMDKLAAKIRNWPPEAFAAIAVCGIYTYNMVGMRGIKRQEMKQNNQL